MTSTESRSVWSDIRAAMKVTVPEGTSGNVELRRFTVSEDAASMTRLRSLMQGGRGSVPAGEYTGLYRSGGLWMSDTNDERRDHSGFLWEAHQRGAETALVSGLGIGMVVAALAVIPSIRKVTVIELDADVIALVGPHLRALYAEAGKELEIVQGDAKDPASTLPKGQRWDVAWHDVWKDLCTDNLPEMATMARRYGRRVGWQDFWSRDILRVERRREARREARWSW